MHGLSSAISLKESSINNLEAKLENYITQLRDLQRQIELLEKEVYLKIRSKIQNLDKSVELRSTQDAMDAKSNEHEALKTEFALSKKKLEDLMSKEVIFQISYNINRLFRIILNQSLKISKNK